jgi:hypothetical protein
MRLSLFVLGVIAAIVSVEKPAEAQNGGCVRSSLVSIGWRS